MADTGPHGGRCGGLLGGGDAGGGAGKPLTVVRLLGDERTATAIEADLLRFYGVDLLDLYRGTLSLRRVCALITHLPEHAALWRTGGEDGGWTRTEVLLAAVERRVTVLWATVAAAFGQQVTDEHLTSPLNTPTTTSTGPTRPAEPELVPLREIALMMRNS